MTTFDHNQICTKDKAVEVGKLYDYYEEGHICRVKVLEDTSDNDGIGFNLKIEETLSPLFKEGTEFSCWAATGKFAYSGMWRIYNYGEYQKF